MTVFPGEVVKGKYSPIVIMLVIVLNVAVYLYTSYSSYSPLFQTSDQSVLDYGFKPIYLLSDPVNGVVKMFTSMFIHADLFHIFFNMYFLWLFGSRIEGLIGHIKTIGLYLLSGISAVLFHV
ncbi:MAG: rhomboid family intramembrane serine protease, partial [Desulfurococcaceae archaeon]